MDTNPIIAVFGRRGKGKTTWLARYIYDNLDKTFFIYDVLRDKAFYPFYGVARFYSSVDEFLDDSDIESSSIYIFQGEIDYNDFFGLCYELGNNVCIFDELDLACSPHYLSENLYKIIHYGRHKNVGIVGSSRRPANVTRDFTSQAHLIILYELSENLDLKYIENFCGAIYAEKVKKQRRGHCLVWPPKSEFEQEIS